MYLAKRFLLDHMRGFLHLFGETNTKPKWVFEMCDNLPGSYNLIKDEFLTLMNMNGVKIPDKFFERFSILVDTIFLKI